MLDKLLWYISEVDLQNKMIHQFWTEEAILAFHSKSDSLERDHVIEKDWLKVGLIRFKEKETLNQNNTIIQHKIKDLIEGFAQKSILCKDFNYCSQMFFSN
jgi:hypothetical protein